MTTLNVLFTVF